MGAEDFKTFAILSSECKKYTSLDGIPFFLEMNDQEQPYCKIFSQDLVSHLSEEELRELCPHMSACSVLEKMRDSLSISHYYKRCDWKPSPEQSSGKSSGSENSRIP